MTSSRVCILPNFHVDYFANLTKFYAGSKELFHLARAFRSAKEKEAIEDLAAQIFSGFNFELSREELLDVGLNDAYQSFRKRIDELGCEYELEKYGLGKSPYKFLGSMEAPPKSLQESNPEAYNNALRDFPRFDAGGIGSCARCYTHISIHYIFKSSDNRIFPLGSDCVCHLNDVKLTKLVADAKANRDRELREKKKSQTLSDFDELFSDPDVIQKLRSLPPVKHHRYEVWSPDTKKWWDGQNPSLYEQIAFRAKGAGAKTKKEIMSQIKKIMDS